MDLTTGSIVLDIGEDAGALVVYTDASRAGEEVEVERCSDGHRQHVAVLRRVAAARTDHAAVFATLRAGRYRLRWTPDAVEVDVAAGLVLERDERSARSPRDSVAGCGARGEQLREAAGPA